jgi:hypothetical protein
MNGNDAKNQWGRDGVQGSGSKAKNREGVILDINGD